jgi:SAM-dependent methyltransferase
MPCPVCGGGDVEVFFCTEKAPVFCNVLWQTREQALQADCAAIDLAYCPVCGMVYNACFDEQRVRYAPGYENSLFFSPHYQQYARGIAQRLIEQYCVKEKMVVEIGCGTGEFLGLLAEMGNNEAFGFDPSYDPARTAAKPAGGTVTIVPDVFAPGRNEPHADLVCCRHVLEHVADPLGFLRDVRETMEADPNRVLHLEVPNGRFVLSDQGVWDVIYEHCSYFTQEALTYLLTRAGFDVLEVAERYDGQFLTIESRPASTPSQANPQDQTEVAILVHSFGARSQSRVRFWQERLSRAAGSGSKQVLWGAGSKGVMFLNVLGIDDQAVAHVVDINDKKHGRFIPGTGQMVISPEQVKAYEPHEIILMNPVYRDEVARMLSVLGVTSEIIPAWD